ncbi:MAG: sigma-54-dependent transcriptional regulator [Polyangiales bacterium]
MRVLWVDEDDAVHPLSLALEGGGFAVVERAQPKAAVDAVRTARFDALVSRVQGEVGVDLMRSLREVQPDLPIVRLGASYRDQDAFEAVAVGVSDVLPEPVSRDVLVHAVWRAVTFARFRRELRRGRRSMTRDPSDELVGDSPTMRDVRELVGRIAASDAPVLLTGESGSGKELIARAIHARSPLTEGPFVAINCAALPPHLLESELFGHVKGAFTDAHRSKTGLFVEADGGTLFLDEVADLPLAIQPKLLRALQERVVRPVGGETEIPFGSRIISATNRDLRVLVSEKRFREDLYFRLDVLHVRVPPLRARHDDILPLARYFLARSAARADKNVTTFSPAAEQALAAYPWPGNVRELENCIERAVALTITERITTEALPKRVRAFRTADGETSEDAPPLMTLDEVDRRHVARILAQVGGNKSEAARLLGVPRKSLYRMLARWGTRRAS